MKLKHKLAKKYLTDEKTPLVPTAEEIWVAGFDKAKLYFIDYAQRFLDNPNLKPGQHHEQLFKKIGEQEFPDY